MRFVRFILHRLPITREWLTILRRRHPLRTRLDLVVASVLRRLPFPKFFGVHIDECVLYFARETAETDNYVFGDIFERHTYAADYAGACVVDIGAHKGYYAVYAFSHGAKVVISYEPEPRNFSLLDRSASSVRRKGKVWQTHNAAVSSRRGRGVLHVFSDSWSHSLVRIDKEAIDTRSVEVEAFADVIASAMGHGDRIVVKIDAEGSECDILLDTPVEALSKVDHLLVEFHSFAQCEERRIIDRLDISGLRLVRRIPSLPHNVLVFSRGT